MKEEFERLLNEALSVNKDINYFLNDFALDEEELNDQLFLEFNEKLEYLLERKDDLINSLSELKNKNPGQFNKLKNNVFKDSWQSLQDLEKQNLELLNDKKDFISRELSGIRTGSKAVKAYKYTKELKPRLFDDKEA